jgi:hypothetical protein
MVRAPGRCHDPPTMALRLEITAPGAAPREVPLLPGRTEVVAAPRELNWPFIRTKSAPTFAFRFAVLLSSAARSVSRFGSLSR